MNNKKTHWDNAPRTNLNDTKTNPIQPYTTMAGHGSTRRRFVLISESPIFGKLTKPSTTELDATHMHTRHEALTFGE